MRKKLLTKKVNARLEAIDQFNPFSDISDLGSILEFSVGPSNILECKLFVNSANVMPTEIKSLQKTEIYHLKNAN